jgi:hypothetical protein
MPTRSERLAYAMTCIEGRRQIIARSDIVSLATLGLTIALYLGHQTVLVWVSAVLGALVASFRLALRTWNWQAAKPCRDCQGRGCTTDALPLRCQRCDGRTRPQPFDSARAARLNDFELAILAIVLERGEEAATDHFVCHHLGIDALDLHWREVVGLEMSARGKAAKDEVEAALYLLEDVGILEGAWMETAFQTNGHGGPSWRWYRAQDQDAAQAFLERLSKERQRTRARPGPRSRLSPLAG